jgi:hypothetical protein
VCLGVIITIHRHILTLSALQSGASALIAEAERAHVIGKV